MKNLDQRQPTSWWKIAAAVFAVAVAVLVGAAIFGSAGPAAAPRPHPASQAGARRVLAALRRDGDAEYFAITGVRQDGDTLIVSTDLYPKAENEPAAMGACTSVQGIVGASGGYGVTTSSVEVLGQHGSLASSWSPSDASCQVASAFGG